MGLSNEQVVVVVVVLSALHSTARVRRAICILCTLAEPENGRGVPMMMCSKFAKPDVVCKQARSLAAYTKGLDLVRTPGSSRQDVAIPTDTIHPYLRTAILPAQLYLGMAITPRCTVLRES